MNVRSLYTRNLYKVSTPTGTPFLNEYQEEIDRDTGRKSLVLTGKKNVYELIQVDRESTKIENILQRAALGDLAALNAREPMYIDATTMPKSLMEVQNIVLKAKQEFEKMPLEVKELFHNSPEEYVSMMGTNEFLEKMGPYNKKIADIKEAGNLKEYERKVREEAKFRKAVDNAMKEGQTSE